MLSSLIYTTTWQKKFQSIVQIVWLLESITTTMQKLTDEHYESVHCGKWKSFAKVVASILHMICRYLDKFLLQGAIRNWHHIGFYYLAPSLIREGYWKVTQVNNIKKQTFQVHFTLYIRLWFWSVVKQSHHGPKETKIQEFIEQNGSKKPVFWDCFPVLLLEGQFSHCGP